ncbi:MAG: phosphocholine cytidylyltransferase family protein [Salinivirgaceae bacterium]|nr:phosphocholine cytidylyltransferase family protein [Salinivirgaceae bacterium]
MKAVILAAGTASRLRPLTSNTPKCLLKVNGKTLLERTLDNFISNGITEFLIVTGYLQEMIIDFVKKNYPKLNVKFLYNKDFATTNNIYSLYLAEEFACGNDFILSDSDILFSKDIITALLVDKNPDVLAMNRHELGEEEIKIISDSERNVLEISKVCSIEKAVGESVGLEKMSAEYSAALYKELHQMIDNEGLSNVFYEKAFERLIPQGHIFKYLDTTDFFSMEIDTVEDYDKIKDLKI